MDNLIPVEQGRLLVEALDAHGVDVSMLELPHDDHGLVSVFGDHGMVPVHLLEDDPIRPAMQQVIDFLDRTLQLEQV